MSSAEIDTASFSGQIYGAESCHDSAPVDFLENSVVFLVLFAFFGKMFFVARAAIDRFVL